MAAMKQEWCRYPFHMYSLVCVNVAVVFEYNKYDAYQKKRFIQFPKYKMTLIYNYQFGKLCR